jgi:glutaredoxin
LNPMSMEYLLFTYPNCQKCEALKKALSETDLRGAEYNLIQKESKLRIRNFLSVIKRDKKGGIIVPTLVLQEAGKVVAVLNNQEELVDWLRSRA